MNNVIKRFSLMTVRLFAIAAAAVFVLGATEIKAFAANSYTYTVTVYAGDKGTFSGTDFVQVNDKNAIKTLKGDNAVVISNISAGSQITIRAQQGATVNNGENYVVQGVRRSGRDNDNDDVHASASEKAERSADYQPGSFTVNYDRDYVISYTRQGELTKYTINYVSADGSKLAESEEYYGNVDDKPVIAYLYIEGYQPQAFNLAKTLVSDESKNVFTFVYSKVESNSETVIDQGTTNVNGGQGNQANQENQDDQGNQGNQANQENQVDETNEQDQQTDIDNAGNDHEDEQISEPQDIVDLDEEETPLTNPDLDEDSKSISEANRMKGFAAAAVGTAALVVLAGMIFVSIINSKKKDNK